MAGHIPEFLNKSQQDLAATVRELVANTSPELNFLDRQSAVMEDGLTYRQRLQQWLGDSEQVQTGVVLVFADDLCPMGYGVQGRDEMKAKKGAYAATSKLLADTKYTEGEYCIELSRATHKSHLVGLQHGITLCMVNPEVHSFDVQGLDGQVVSYCRSSLGEGRVWVVTMWDRIIGGRNQTNVFTPCRAAIYLSAEPEEAAVATARQGLGLHQSGSNDLQYLHDYVLP